VEKNWKEEKEMNDEQEVVPGPDSDDANQTDGNQRDEDGNLVTPPPSDPDGDNTSTVEPAGDPSINPTTPPPAPQPEQP
jgi:hypothetical protein